MHTNIHNEILRNYMKLAPCLTVPFKPLGACAIN